jgi:cytidine deaminase
LLDDALAARERAYCPYSALAVGAAVLDEQERIHSGCNVENAASPEGWCAEATALGAMVMAGGRQVRAIVVAGPGPEVLTPCGGCRQRLSEFAAPDLVVFAADPGGIRAQWTLEQLLPASFGTRHRR